MAELLKDNDNDDEWFNNNKIEQQLEHNFPNNEKNNKQVSIKEKIDNNSTVSKKRRRN